MTRDTDTEPKRSILKPDTLTTIPVGVMIEFGIEWQRGSMHYGTIGGRWGIPLAKFSGPNADKLRADIMALVQQAAEQVTPPEEAQEES